MREPPQILLVDDDPDDYVIMLDLLTQAYGKDVSCDWVSNWDEAVDTVGAKRHDVYMIDYELGMQTGLELVNETELVKGDAPVLMLTGHSSLDIDQAAMNAGIADYLVKNELTVALVERAIRYAIERKKVESRLAYNALHDPLTGLGNRDLFRERLESSMRSMRRGSRSLAVLVLDLDNFKNINDSLGHPIGDALLRQVGIRLQGLVRETDTVVRLGGDEFAIILTFLNSTADAAAFAQKTIGGLRQPYWIEDNEIHASVSIGIAMYPDDTGDPDELFKNADLALYKVKGRGRNGFDFFDDAMTVEAQARRRLDSDIRQALQEQSFVLHFQPKVDMRSHEIVGVEALIRWMHPRDGFLLPGAFIPGAEASGLIVPVGDWVLREACRQSRAWVLAGLPELQISVNLSIAQMKQPQFAARALSILEEFRVPPATIELEITESIFMDNQDDSRRTLDILREAGLHVAIDDFGTGFSSLRYLKQFPIDTLKIDRSFVRDIAHDSGDAAIVRTIIQLADSFGLGVVAEGVETSEQLRVLCENGCRFAQGFYFSPAISADELDDMYRSGDFGTATAAMLKQGRRW